MTRSIKMGQPAENAAKAMHLMLFLALCTACEPGGPSEPEPARLTVYTTTADGVIPTAPLRLAVVWRLQSARGFNTVTTADEPLASLNGEQTLSIQLPPKSVRGRVIERSKAYVSCSEDSEYFIADVLIPRVVIYEDLDRNGIFNPDLPNSPGVDRVWATTETHLQSQLLVSFTDLDEALSHEPMEIAECVRSNTGGQYTAFFMASNYSSYVSPTGSSLQVALDLSPTDYPRAVLGCDSYISDSPGSYSTTNYASRTAFVDNSVGAGACAGSPYTCSTVDVASTLPASTDFIDYPGYERSFLCTVSGNLDVLWLTDSVLTCDGCDCTWTETDTTWVVNSAARPSDWPCGASLLYCVVPQESLWKQPSYCGGYSAKRPL